MTPEQAVVATPWPADALPVEIFNLILNYLPRSSIQNMRLVNKEFESKVSHYLFRVVVLPFRPEIYGISPEPDVSGSRHIPIDSVMRDSVKLQHKGMKVFQGFGRRINKFAMSFEFDEKQLAFPPLKSDQESITSFWGVYRWPFKKYNRYAQLEGLEQAADETGTMTEALRCIVNAKELGISIDGGLGWLAGPDVSPDASPSGAKPPVFGKSLFAPEPPPDPDLVVVPNFCDMGYLVETLFANSDITVPAIKAALQRAGFEGDSLDESVQTLLQMDWFTDSMVRGEGTDRLPGANWNALARAAAQQRQIASTVLTGEDADDVEVQADLSDEGNDNESPPATPATQVVTNNGDSSGSQDERYPLKPNDLTSRQREMLLEVEWAQRAFMQSYAIAIIDNKATFQNIELFTIARLPSRHLPILRRSDFWDSLPGLKSLSLAIIPDWRDVVKLPTSWVQDDKVLPSQAVSVVYKILEEQILRRENIKTLHFEWLCGGEEAQGLFARNQHILPAPIVPNAMDMAHRDLLPEVLGFHYIEHLSLKNCWITPHIMARLSTSIRGCVLESLTLNSVSLTAPLPADAHLSLIPETRNFASNAQLVVSTAAAHNHFVNIQGIGAALGPNLPNLQNLIAQAIPQPAVVLAAVAQLAWLDAPRSGSWSQFIDGLTPGNNLADMRYALGLGEEPPHRSRSSILKLKFESCGYVRLPLDFDQTVLDPPDVLTISSTVSKRLEGVDRVMMKSNDPAQAAIVNHIDEVEKKTLQEGFDLTVNWDSSRSDMTEEAMMDGISHPGRGRFSGLIDISHD